MKQISKMYFKQLIGHLDFKQLIRLFIVGILIFYFVNKVVDSVNKLQEAKIGTLFRKITEELVEGRRQCCCIFMFM